MDHRQNQTLKDNNDNIDLISFDRRKRTAEIIRNEEIERERRRKEQYRRRQIERMRRIKAARLRGLFILGITAIGSLFIIIGIIVAIVNAVSTSKNNDVVIPNNRVSDYEIQLLNNFSESSGHIYYNGENNKLSSINDIISPLTATGADVIPATTKYVSDFGHISQRYMFMKDNGNYSAFRETVKNVPIFSNGYIWSETDSMKSTITDGYLYDTNTSFIIAVANICLSEGSTAFLNEVDTDAMPKRDVSLGITVSKKLEMAINYLFDNNTLDGGFKYDSMYTSLCYIHTTANSGNSKGTPSNRWTNYKFGYLDAYCNISFNKAMRALEKLYKLQGLTDEANKYKAVADKNATAFSDRFWNPQTGRFVGCIDRDEKAYDYGFTFINLEAIANGMATDSQKEQIISWLDGSRTVLDDASTGADIYHHGIAPRSNTLPADDKLWDTLGGTVILSGNGAYGLYHLNGGASVLTAYYDLVSRDCLNLTDLTESKINTFLDEYKNTGFVYSDMNKAIDANDNPLTALIPHGVLTTVFGLSTDGLHLTINPRYDLLFENLPGTTAETTVDKAKADTKNTIGIKNISFRGNRYSFLYDNNVLFVTSELYGAVRLNAGGFVPGETYNLIKVQGDTFTVDNTPIMADDNGMLSIVTDFGSDNYIKIEKASEPAQK